MKNKQQGSFGLDFLFIFAIMIFLAVAFHFYQSRPASPQKIAQLTSLLKQVPIKDVSHRDQHDLARVLTHKSLTVGQASLVRHDLRAIIRKRHDKQVLTHFLASHQGVMTGNRS